MLDRLERLAPNEAARAAEMLWPFWLGLGRGREGRSRLEALLESELTPASRAVVHRRLAETNFRLGDLAAAQLVATKAVELAEKVADGRTAAFALLVLSLVSLNRGDLDEALRLVHRVLEEHPASGTDGWLPAIAGLGLILAAAGRDEEARAAFRQSIDACAQIGDVVNEALMSANLAELELFANDFESARARSERALATGVETGHRELEMFASFYLGEGLLGLGRRAEARAALRNALEIASTDGGHSGILYNTLGAVALAADARQADAAALLRGVAKTLRDADGVEQKRRQTEFERPFEGTLIESLGAEEWSQAQVVGAAMTRDQAVELAHSLCDDRT